MADVRSRTGTVRIGLSIITGAVLLASAAATFFGFAPWLFLLAFLTSACLGLSPRIGWAVSFVFGISTAPFVLWWIFTIDPFIGLRLDYLVTACLTVLGVAALLLGIRDAARGRNRFPALNWRGLVLVVAPAAVTAAALAVGTALRGSWTMSWAMNIDAAANTVNARSTAALNGMSVDNSPVPSLAQGLNALVDLPGQYDYDTLGTLLIHQIQRQSVLWILMILLTSVIASLLAEYVTRGLWVPIRGAAVLVAGTIPLTWHVTGYALSMGFYNIGITFLVLLLSVYLWTVLRTRALLGSAVQLAMAVTMLGAWTPLAIVPFVFATIGAVRGFARDRRRLDIIVWTIAVVQFLLHVIFVIFPYYLRNAEILGSNGGHLDLARRPMPRRARLPSGQSSWCSQYGRSARLSWGDSGSGS